MKHQAQLLFLSITSSTLTRTTNNIELVNGFQFNLNLNKTSRSRSTSPKSHSDSNGSSSGSPKASNPEKQPLPRIESTTHISFL